MFRSPAIISVKAWSSTGERFEDRKSKTFTIADSKREIACRVSPSHHIIRIVDNSHNGLFVDLEIPLSQNRQTPGILQPVGMQPAPSIAQLRYLCDDMNS